MPTVRQNTVPTVSAKLAARVVQRFQKMPSRKTAAIGGAMNPSTDWNTLNRFRPLMASMATVIAIASTAPITTTMRPTRLISHCGAPGLKFFTYTSIVNTVDSAFSAEPIVETRQAVSTANTRPTMPTGNRFSTIVR